MLDSLNDTDAHRMRNNIEKFEIKLAEKNNVDCLRSENENVDEILRSLRGRPSNLAVYEISKGKLILKQFS